MFAPEPKPSRNQQQRQHPTAKLRAGMKSSTAGNAAINSNLVQQRKG